VYHDFVVGAFGEGQEAWRRVSPACQDREVLREMVKSVDALVVAQSRADSLVEWEQAEGMCEVLQDAVKGEEVEISKIRLVELEGEHDEVWQSGTGVVKAIMSALQMLSKPSAGE